MTGPTVPRTDFVARGRMNLNPSDISLWALLVEDWRTHDRLWLEQGLWAVWLHRLANWRCAQPKLIRAPLKPLFVFLSRLLEWMCGITLPDTTRLGRRVRLWHHGSMILNAASIGNDVHIRHNSTFGVARTHENGWIPEIGSDVDLGVGVSVLGPIRIGDGVTVGAHSVVLRDVPDGAVVGGIPARVLRKPPPRVAPAPVPIALPADPG